MTLISIEELLRILYHVFNFLLGVEKPIQTHIHLGSSHQSGIQNRVMDNIYVMETQYGRDSLQNPKVEMIFKLLSCSFWPHLESGSLFHNQWKNNSSI